MRDALPGVTGSQPVLFVFSAGNSGGGNDGGGGGDPDTILSPATAKNVITVGAIEQLRNITNIVTDRDSNSSAYWQPETDTSFQLAGFSSRGNVGIGTEGTSGRFKPDVVAPGTFVISTRSSKWDEHAYYNPTNYNYTIFENQSADPQTLNYYSVFVPGNAVGIMIQIVPNRFSSSPFPTNMPIYVELADLPTTNTFDFLTTSNEVSIPPNSGGNITSIQDIQNIGFWYAIGNDTGSTINYDIITEIITTNDLGTYYNALSNLNNSLGGSPDSTVPPHYYRYESGTSMSAADVSGVLALMQEFLTSPSYSIGITPSPALLKAMLINGARSDGNYDFQVQNSINYQGWGLVNLPNSLPPGITTKLNNANGESMLILDQSPTNGLATGDSHTYRVALTSAGAAVPLHITLAWTDPPGDPAAAIKLVNDLNLVVTNLDHPTNVYYGNDIPASSIYNSMENSTNAPNYDAINNVENVYLPGGVGTNYSITVMGYRVNVNAVTAHTNNVVQDFALVISSGNGQVTNAFTVTDSPIISNPTTDQQITYVITTNTPLMNQLAGASTPLLGTNNIQLTAGTTELNGIQLWPSNVLVTLGMTNQWHFYVVTNTGPADFTNAAFITFDPNTLSVPRMGVFANPAGNANNLTANVTRPEADIDLYVSADPNLLLMHPDVISNADKSVGRGGVEFVAYSNSAPGKVYYIGVYSEDQEASEYGFIPIFTDIPFSQMNPNGSQTVNGLTVPVNIPDGSTAHPGIARIFALAIDPMQVKRVVVNNTIAHQNFGDLIGTLAHSQQTGLGKNNVLNNHDSFYNESGIYTNIYDDSRQGYITGSRLSDGPGSLNNFIGQQAIGPWILTEADTSQSQTGSVTGFSLLIEPHNGKNGATTFESTPPCTMSQTDFIDVPPGATNLTILVTNLTTPGPQSISLYVRYGAWPTTNLFDEVTNLVPPVTNGVISIGPPLTPGRYFYGVYAPCSDTASQSNSVTATYYMGAVPAQVVFGSSGPAPILDDAVVTNTIYVTAAQTISSVDVSLRVDHPRVSDLVFHLTSPAGSRVLLVENRGGTTTNGMGQTLAITNVVPVSSSGSSSPTTNVVNTVTSSGALEINYNFYTLPDEMVIYDQSGSGVPIFDSGLISGSGIFNIAYTNSNFLTIEMNPFGNNEGTGDLWDYAVVAAQVKYTYLTLTENTNLTTTPIKFAPPPFVGVLTNVFGKAVVTNITTSLTNTVVVTNTLIITNTAIITNLLIANEWHNSFEGYSYSVFSAPSHFAGGWSVDSGSVDVYVNGGPPPSGSTADEGTNYIDLDGSTPGTISTNLATVPGQSYTLTFTYAQNADGKSFDHPTASMQVLQNSNPLLSLTVNQTNGWSNLGWTTTSAVFTATANPTKISFQSLDPAGDAYGVLLDCVNLASPMNDGFENTAIGNYAAGVNPGFAGWAVTTNQVTVISNTTLAYGGSTNLLALANGTISRILPTVPGQTYVLTYAYRGPGAISLWRGEGNAIDPISANNGTAENDLGYAAGEVNSAFNMATAGYVFIPASPSLDIGPGPGFTLDAWIAPTAISAANPYPIIEWSQAGGVYSGLSFFVSSFFFNSSGCLCAGFVASNNVAVGNSIFSAPNIVTANVFQHVALTYNHTTGAAAMYLNGVRVASTNNVGNFVTWTTGNVLIGRRININTPSQNFHFPGSEDEISIYGRDLSASEILAIYQKGSLGKYDLAAPTFAQGLAEAQLTLGGTPFPVFYGNNTNWQTTNITFVAAQSNEPNMVLFFFGTRFVTYCSPGR